MNAKWTLLILCVAANGAQAADCGSGTVAANFERFHSAEFAGRLALAPWATNSSEAKTADLYCVLRDSPAYVRRPLDRVYFVFNNMVTSSPENAETVFTGLEVRAVAAPGPTEVKMRKEGKSWEQRTLDQQYPVNQIAFREDDARAAALVHRPIQVAAAARFSSDGIGAFGWSASESEFARRVKASVHGAVKPKAGAELKTTWERRHDLRFVSELFGADDVSGQSVTAVWTSFDQRPAGFLNRRKRVATEVRVGNAQQIEVHFFGSNGEIPELNYRVIFTDKRGNPY